MPKFLRDMLTEFSSDTPSFVRILAVLGVVEYLGIALAKFLRSGDFAMQDFGIGLGAVIVAVGGAMRLGEREQKQEEKS